MELDHSGPYSDNMVWIGCN